MRCQPTVQGVCLSLAWGSASRQRSPHCPLPLPLPQVRTVGALEVMLETRGCSTLPGVEHMEACDAQTLPCVESTRDW